MLIFRNNSFRKIASVFFLKNSNIYIRVLLSIENLNISTN